MVEEECLLILSYKIKKVDTEEKDKIDLIDEEDKEGIMIIKEDLIEDVKELVDVVVEVDMITIEENMIDHVTTELVEEDAITTVDQMMSPTEMIEDHNKGELAQDLTGKIEINNNSNNFNIMTIKIKEWIKDKEEVIEE